MRWTRKLTLVILAGLALTMTACNLVGNPNAPPPTLQVRITDQPLPTLGYSTPEPDNGIPPAPTAAASNNAELYGLLNMVDCGRTYSYVDALVGFETRHVNSSQDSTTEGIGAARAYIEQEFAQIQQQSGGLFQWFPHGFIAGADGVTTNQTNIVGVINGSVPNTPVLIIGAHYDSTDANDRASAVTYAPGADDNGTGVAAVIEIARVMSTVQPRATIIFVLFSAEEYDRQGSRSFIQDYLFSRLNYTPDNVLVMINLDSVGSVNDRFGNVNDSQIRLFSAGPDTSLSRNMARMIDFVTDNLNTDLEIVVQDAEDREGRYGDHKSFSDVGFPSVRFIEALEDTNNREGRDTINHIEPEYLCASTRTILTVTYALANGPRPPDERYINFRNRDDGPTRLIWEPVEGAAGYVIAARRPGEMTYEQQFQAPGPDNNVWECECFTSSRFVGMAIAAIDANGVMGPLSREVPVP